MPFPIRSLFASVALICAVHPLRGLDLPVTLRLESSAGWVDNISRTSSGPDQREAARLTATASASTFRNWKSGFVTSADLSATLDHVPDYSRAGAVTLGPQFGVRHKFGLGAFAPVLDASAALAYRDARHSSDNGWTGRASLRFGKRLTRAWRVALTGDWQQHRARAETFDTNHRRLFAGVHWDLSARWQLGAGAGRLWGDFTANAAGPTWARALAGDFGPAISTYYNSVARETTGIYGPNWVTYRVSGHADFQWFELSPAIGRNTSLPLRLERLAATNLVGIKYRQDSVTLSLLHRF